MYSSCTYYYFYVIPTLNIINFLFLLGGYGMGTHNSSFSLMIQFSIPQSQPNISAFISTNLKFVKLIRTISNYWWKFNSLKPEIAVALKIKTVT